jgi:DNA primase
VDGTPPKYKLPVGFRKGLELYNLHRAIQLGARQVVLVEGFVSVMKLYQAGFSAVALMGRALSGAQEGSLFQHFDQVALMLDGDEAGRAATGQIAARLGSRIHLRVCELFSGSQPDQLSAAEIQGLLTS